VFYITHRIKLCVFVRQILINMINSLTENVTFIITNSILGYVVNLHSVSLIHQRYNEVECRTKDPEDTSPWVKNISRWTTAPSWILLLGQKPLVVKFIKGLLSTLSLFDPGASVLRGFCPYTIEVGYPSSWRKASAQMVSCFLLYIHCILAKLFSYPPFSY